MEELAISIDHISKEYRLGAIGGGTLRGDLQSWMARLKGKEDPNSKIGSDAAAHMGEKFLALDDVSFTVRKGEALGIIGHNGAGKSTLLKLLSRVTAPTKGTIRYNGRIASMLEVGTGFHPELTGRENVYMNGAILGMTKAEIDRKFDQIVEFAEMEKFIDTPVKRYSSGMYVKLAFAVAAHLDSEILVMDEVLAVGDMKFQQKCLGKMGDAANSEGRTVLYVSHNMNTIRQLCTRCIVLDHGKLIFDGDVERAIEIYMDDLIAPEIENDCSQLPRKGFSTDGKAFIHKVKFLNVGRPTYKKSDDIVVEISYSAEVDLEHVCIRLPIFYGDNTPIGMATTAPDLHLRKGEHTLKLTFLPRQLAPGTYTIRIVVYSVNQFGTMQNHDVVDNACAFEIESDPNDINGVTWEHRYWGAMQFPALTTEE